MIPVRLSIALKHLFTVHLVNNFEYSMIQYEMQKTNNLYKFVHQNILSFAKFFIVIIFTKYYNEDSK